ncbi:hypothetical protein V496_09679 [Pseudogymnoascus sp. VKM F-4515 (FW-2607)]|nr:hypothetical protein V496_09679 [Pseudogymnoascus sp. VKM F-4515 (FW-2607)]
MPATRRVSPPWGSDAKATIPSDPSAAPGFGGWPRDDPTLEGGRGAVNNGSFSRDIGLNWSPHNTQIRQRDRGGIFWGFSLHSACWDLLTTLRPCGLLDTQAIFDICRSFPPQDGVLLFGHDYGGICEPDSMFAIYPGEKPQRILHKEKPLGFEPVLDERHFNPLKIHHVMSIFEEEHTEYAEQCSTNFLMMGGSTDNDPFSALPFEILELIVVKLTLEDVSQLKLASQIYAKLVLPDIFWHSRFRRGGEFEYLFESMKFGLQCKGRSRSVFLKAKELQDHPQMRSRKRVVTLAWALLELVDRRGRISCSTLDSPPSLLGLLESTAPLDPQKWVTASRSLLPPDVNFDHGTRCLYRLTVGVPSKGTSIFISTIEIFGLLYISGTRFEQQNGESTYVGYIHSQNETLITWADPRPVCITGFQLAQDPRGIRGIAIESAAGVLSNWVGEYVGIPRRRLVPRGSKRDQSYEIALLQGGFDALKLVSLSVARKDETETETQTSRSDEPQEPRDANIWYPQIPDPCLSFESLPELPGVYRQGQDEMPLSMILFGGLKGELLRHVVKMTVWIADTHPAHCVVWGIGFTFDCLVQGQSSLVLGHRRDDGEYNFPIDGRGGERICRMESISQYSSACDLGFKASSPTASTMNDGWTRHFDENTQSWASTNTETGETRYEDDPEELQQAEEVLVNDEYRLVSIVRRKGGDPAFKHWALFVADKDGDSEGFECEVEGSRKRFTYAESRASPKASAATLDIHPVGYVDTDKLQDLRDFARASTIHNEDEYWCCQDFIWTLVEELEGEGLLEHCDDSEGRGGRSTS